MTKKILILPYFGAFNNYFDLWLQSCKHNEKIDWLVITDNPKPQNLPENIRWVRQTFQELKDIFQQKFDFKLSLKNPYKLCDYKGFYGYLFDEYIKGYDFWGYCDCDLVFGDILSFLPECLFQAYDKIFTKGHLSFIRNTPEINTNFKKYETYKLVLSKPVIYGYDEAINGYRKGFAGELLEQGFSVYNEWLPADIDFRYFPFYIVNKEQVPCVFTYEHGRMYKLTNCCGIVSKEEVIYVHLQKRKMRVDKNIGSEKIIFYPNVISNYTEALLNNAEFWRLATINNQKYFNFRKERMESIKKDVVRLLYEPNKLHSITHRIKNMIK